MKTSVNQHFAKRLKIFLKSIVNQRVHLIATGKGMKPSGSMIASVDRLMPYLSMNFTDYGAAIMLLNHQFDIRNIIPSNKSKENRLAHLDTLVTAAKLLTSKTYSNAH